MESIYGASFWSVCHGYKSGSKQRSSDSYLVHLSRTPEILPHVRSSWHSRSARSTSSVLYVPRPEVSSWWRPPELSVMQLELLTFHNRFTCLVFPVILLF